MSASSGRQLEAIVDRIEVRDSDDSTWAVLIVEGATKVLLPMELLPEQVREGSHLSLFIQVDEEAQRARAKRIADLQRELSFRRSTGEGVG